MKTKQKTLLFNIVITAVFSALTFAGTAINIKMPAGDMVHLGNFVMIVAALLLGGLQGGIAGSLGMGFYDVIFYSNRPTTIARTFILKFLIGFLVGYLFRLVIKKKINTTKLLYGSSIFFTVIFVATLILFIAGDKSNFSNNLSAVFYNIFGSKYNLVVPLYIPIFAFVFVAIMLVSAIFSHKLSERSKAALFAITMAVAINIVGEFVLRFLLEGWFVNSFDVSIVVAISKIPGSTITALISIVLSALIYEPVYRAVKNLDMFKDDTVIQSEINQD